VPLADLPPSVALAMMHAVRSPMLRVIIPALGGTGRGAGGSGGGGGGGGKGPGGGMASSPSAAVGSISRIVSVVGVDAADVALLAGAVALGLAAVRIPARFQASGEGAGPIDNVSPSSASASTDPSFNSASSGSPAAGSGQGIHFGRYGHFLRRGGPATSQSDPGGGGANSSAL
jgi:hypothetical protein